MSAIDLTLARLRQEEGVRRYCYNDKTGARVTCKPHGNLTVAIGINLEDGLEDHEIDYLTRSKLTALDALLRQYDWYNTDELRQSVLLDIGYNVGIAGLLHFPHMLAAVARKDWVIAASECRVQEPRLAARYSRLSQILATGADPCSSVSNSSG